MVRLENLKPAKPDLSFLGSRDYLHSTSLFQAFMDYATSHAGLNAIDLDFVFLARTDRAVMIKPAGQTGDKEQIVAKFACDGQDFVASALEEPIKRRIVSDEKTLIGKEDGEDAIHVQTDASVEHFIQSTVANFKFLVQERADDAKPAFARLRIKSLPGPDFVIRYNRFFNKRFHEGQIESDNSVLGQIYFGQW